MDEIRCPVCGGLAPDDPARPPEQTACLPTNCSAWRVVGKSKNGGPLLRIVQP